MAIFVPIIVLIVLVVVQASIACVISSKMTQGAHLAARALATQYGNNPSIAIDKTMQQTILTNVRLQNYVADNSQFELDDNSWRTTATPPTVTVTCNYLPGVGNPPLAPFPSFDPLGLGKSFKISAAATCRLH
jgi:Flp pilus assembly protein TadG